MQKGCRALLPEIEHRLQAEAQWLAEVCEHQGTQSTTVLNISCSVP